MKYENLIEKGDMVVVYNIISGVPLDKCEIDVVRLDQDYINVTVMFIALCSQEYGDLIPVLIRDERGEVIQSKIDETMDTVLKELALNVVEGGKKGKLAKSIIEKAAHFRDVSKRSCLMTACNTLLNSSKARIE